MNSTTIFIIVFILFIVWKQMNQINIDKAKELAMKGALIIDVRTAGEFAGEHLQNAINIPLGEEQNKIEEHTKTKEDAILIYCLSGSRSAIATRSLRKAGYENAHNLGSIRRAKSIEE